MKDCIFCKIVSGEIPSHKIYEDDEFVAILDINPNTDGMTLVLTKKHYPAYVFDLPDDVFQKLMKISKKVAKLLDEKLNVKRTGMVMECMEIDHAHIKLYPLHGLEKTTQKELSESWSSKKVFFDNYQGYITTRPGPGANDEKLRKLAEKIKM